MGFLSPGGAPPQRPGPPGPTGLPAASPPGGLPPGIGAPPGAPQPAGAPPVPPPVPPPAVPVAPPPPVYTELSDKIPKHWGLVDIHTRGMEQAMRTGGFYGQPEAEAALKGIIADLHRLIAEYATADSKKAKAQGALSAPTSSGDDLLMDESPGDETEGTAQF